MQLASSLAKSMAALKGLLAWPRLNGARVQNVHLQLHGSQ
jgi:hypothetical protein